jgi:hypothetical protein
MPVPTIITYRDAIEHLVAYEDALGEEAQQNRARAAVQQAYRELALEHRWRYLLKHHRITVEDKYTTGTVTYTASSRTVTGSGTTFPTWAAYGSIIFDGDTVIYRVSSRSSATALVLESDFAPAADKASGTYTLYRSIYPLPGDFYRLEEVFDEQVWRTSYVEPSEWLRLGRHIPRGGRPWYWTLMGCADAFGSMAIHFYGRVETTQTFDFIYSKMPRRLKYDGYAYYSSQGSATLTAAARTETTATVNGVSLEEDVVNAMIRTAMTGATKPPGGTAAVERFAEQKVITARGSDAAVTVGSAWEFTKASNHFAISDPVDLPEYLLDAFYRGCEYQMAIMQQSKGRAEALAAYHWAIRRARAKDGSELPTAESPFSRGWKDPSWQFITGTITQN